MMLMHSDTVARTQSHAVSIGVQMMVPVVAHVSTDSILKLLWIGFLLPGYNREARPFIPMTQSGYDESRPVRGLVYDDGDSYVRNVFPRNSNWLQCVNIHSLLCRIHRVFHSIPIG